MATPNLNAITTVTPGILASAQLASGDNAVYTVPAGKAVKLTPLILTNTSAAAVTVAVSIIPSGGATDGTHKVLYGYSLAANEAITIDQIDGMWLGDGDKVSVNVSASSAVAAVLTGLVFA